MQQSLTWQHIGQCSPALEGTEYRTFGGVIHRILFYLSAMRRLPRIVIFQLAIENMSKDLLICRKKPAFQRAGIRMRAQPFRRGSRRSTANAVRVNNADIRVKPLFTFACKGPQTIEERLCIGHFFTLAGLHLRLGPVDGVDFRP